MPEFGGALAKLKKGEMTAEPVKSQFGWHIIRSKTPAKRRSRPSTKSRRQLKQRIEQVKLQQFQEDLRTKAKTDYKFPE